ncbi:SDR family NAD(P)-dependent oxidoreductase [Micromonospora tulbaghiae]|uniref:Acyl transferase domain-containing protein n=1 Tax=Micromonospora tulbaghiae TaxID=479978 RepID=A0ABY0KIC2_9ACTN|nr:SDR family NAD(P)-dependent oxidoreductase [Micromonospora tulbaghiae]SCE73393.1 Acyl transferase domain-containing protein [Micromonospora tulbaghiae]
MPTPEIDCRLVLRHTDFIMQNHRVHGVSLLPGVALLDVLSRILLAQGADLGRVSVGAILFDEPIATRDGVDREIEVHVGAADDHGTRAVRVHSRDVVDGEAAGPWRANLRAELSSGPGEERGADIDIAALKAGAVRRRDMAELYAAARAEDIRHGAPMRCTGPLHIGPGYMLAELELEEPAHSGADRFHLHPAMLDAATIAAYGLNEAASEEPYIPLHIERFRSSAPLRGRMYVHVPHKETFAASRDIIRSDYTLHDEHGRFVAEFTGLSCKRIRHAGLITRLVGDAQAPAGPVRPAGSATPAVETPGGTPYEQFRAYLRNRVADALVQDPEAIATGTGFYDLGLDSVTMLRISEDLEAVTGTALYPTLLFEFTDIESLARHLAGRFTFRPPDGPPGEDDRVDAATPAAVRVFRPVWSASPPAGAGAADAGPLVVVGADDGLLHALRQRTGGRRIVAVTGGAAFTGTAGDRFRLDPASADDVRRLLDAVDERDTGGASIVVVTGAPAPAEAAASAWRDFDVLRTLAAAVVDRQPTTPRRLLAVHLDPEHGVPAGADASAALCRTISAETPVLRCTAVRLAAAPPDAMAAALLTELATADGEAAVRYVDGRRHVRRYRPANPAQGAAPLRDDGVYVVTGGGGALAGLVAEHLVRTRRARIALIGRSPLSAGRRAQLRDWEEQGARVRYLRADVSRRDELDAALDEVRTAFGRIDGVIHAAGAVRDGLYFRKRPDDVADVLAPKIAGVEALDAATAGDDLDFFAIFSSLAASVGNPGQSDYAYANGFLDAFAERRAARADRRGRTLAVAWPLWAGGGMTVTPEAGRRARRDLGTEPMPTATGLDVLERGLAGTDVRLVVAYGDPDRLADLLPAPREADGGTGVVSPAPATPAPTGDPVVTPAPDDIAVIGLAGRYPLAPDLDTFWANLLSGRDCVTGIPADRWDHDRFYHPDPRAGAGRTYGRWGGFLDRVGHFDPAFFGISRREAERMDPQERLFLMVSWHAFEDAGYPPAALSSHPVGVFAGVMWNHYQMVEPGRDGVAPTAMHAAVANRVSYCLDLTGPSMAVDTACSSSLTAVHLAAESIRRGECDLALAGGVNVTAHPQKYLQLAQGQFLSTDGRCRSFGRDGDGYVPGEGVGAVVLKPLARALADGDHVYGVLKGSSVNHTGRTAGFTVPSPTSQAALITDAIRRAGVEVDSVGYVEAHGTGTSLGDPIEIQALTEAFAGRTAAAEKCAIGSVKSAIGHLESAAGIAGLTKVLLQMRHRTLVPSLHADDLNPHIDFDSAPVAVQRSARPWPQPPGGLPRRAGVSAFGAGGANAHLIVEAPAPADRPAAPAGPVLFVLSARTDQALRDYARSHLDALSAPSGPAGAAALPWLREQAARMLDIPVDDVDPGEKLGDLGFDPARLRDLAQRAQERFPHRGAAAGWSSESTLDAVAARCEAEEPAAPALDDIAWTSQVGRTAMARRLAIVADDHAGLRDGLRRYLDGEPAGPDHVWDRAPAVDAAPGPDRCAELFRDGCLRELAEHWVAGGEVPWDRCHRAVTGVRRPRRVPLPPYPFQEERYWLGGWESRTAPAASPARAVSVAPAEPVAEVAPYAGTELEMRVLDPGIALLTMRDTANTNMFSDGLLHGLRWAFAEVQRRPDVKVVVLTGSGGVFSMGGTPEALLTLAGGAGRFTDIPFLYEGLLRCDRPVVAAMQGHASGGGLIFGLHADVVVMSRDAVYSANFTRYGFTPGMGATYALERRFGRSTASEMLYTGRSFSGDALAARGAEPTFLPEAEVLPAALDIARGIAEQPLPVLTELKRDLGTRIREQMADAIDREVAMHDRVVGEESLGRIREHFRRVDGFSRPPTPREPAAAPAAPADVSPAPAAEPPASVPSPVAVPSPASVAAPVPSAVAAAQNPVSRDAAVSAVEEVLCAQLYLDRAELDRTLTFNEMGVDSVGAVDIIRDLNRRFGLDLDTVVVYDHPTVPALAAHLVEAGARAASLRAAGTAAAPDGSFAARPFLRRAFGDTPSGGDAAVTAPAPASPVPSPPAAAPAWSAPTPASSAPTPASSAPAPASPAAASASSPSVAASPAPASRLPAPAAVMPAASPVRAAAASGNGRITLVAARTGGGSAPASPPAPAPAPATGVRPDDRPGAADIAVIGMAGRFPEAPDLDAFWANIVAGRCSVTEVPGDRWDVGRYFDRDRHASGRTYSRWAASLSDVDAFDASFFRLSALEAQAMDPQQRVFLEVAWSGLEDAGYALGPDRENRCGVFVGASGGDYLRLLAEAGQDDSAQAFLGNSMSILAARISYLLNLTGPAVAVDTACSSSLVAVHLAAEALRRGDCEMAVAGGVAIMVTERMHVWTSRAGMLSPTGRCAPFDASADGIVLGEGAGAVVLKRLDRALADGDTVHAVIRGSGTNGDGRSNGITAPSAASQAALLESVHRRAGVRPDQIGYVEAHGTGTALGDPIEAKALNEVFRRDTARRGYCGLGSVKANIGHTSLAAGVAGLLKVVLALRHRTLPPTVHFDTPNPKIDLADSPFFAVPEPVEWPAGDRGRRIGVVSSFGFSGTNCHVVVESPPESADPVRPALDRPVLVPLSAMTPEALARQARQLTGAVEATGPDLGDLAFTLGVARAHFPVRAAVTARDRTELLTGLRALADGRTPAPAADPALRDLAAGYLAGGDVDWAAQHGGRAVRRISLPTYPFAKDRHWVSTPAARRPSGSVAAVTPIELRPDDALIRDHRVAGATLLAGVTVLDLAAGELARRGLPAPWRLTSVRWSRPLEVTGVREVALRLTPSGPRRFDVTLTGGTAGDAPVHAQATVEAAPPTSPGGHLDTAAVRGRCAGRLDGAEIYHRFAAAGIAYGPAYQALAEVFVGDGEALGHLPGPDPADVGAHRLHPALLDGALQTVTALEAERTDGPLVPFGIDVLEVTGPLRTPLWSHVRRTGDGRYDAVLAGADGTVVARCEGFALRPQRVTSAQPEVFVCTPVWQDAAEPVAAGDPGTVAVLHTTGERGLADELCAAQAGAALRLPLDGDPAAALHTPVDTVYVVAGDDTTDPADTTVTLAFLRLARALLAGHRSRALRLAVVTRGAVATHDGEAVRPSVAGLLGAARSLAAEAPGWTVGCVDIGPDAAIGWADRIRREPLVEPLVALRPGRRLTRAFAPLPPSPDAAAPWRDGGAYLVAGGAGGLGLALSRHLAATHRAALVWLGRREPGPEIDDRIREIESLGGSVLYQRADLTDAAAVRAAVAAARARFGRLHGAVHAAGVWHDGTVPNLDERSITEVLDPKVRGSVVLAEALRDETLDFLIFFSSAASFVDAGGQANYAAASTFQDAYAFELRRRGVPARTVNWGYWGSVGAVRGARYAERFAALGVASIEPPAGMAALRRILGAGAPQALVLRAERGRLPGFGIRLATTGPAEPAEPTEPAVAVGPAGSAVTPAPARSAAAVRDYVRRVFAEVLRCAPESLLDDETFETYGVDSMIGTSIVHRLEQDLGPLPQTLLFEHMTVGRLGDHLAAEHGGRLDTLLRPPAPVTVAPREETPAAGPVPSAGPAPAVPVASADIAVIGVSGRYPGAADVAQFWRNLSAGASGVTEVPAERWDWRTHFDARRGQPNRTYGRWAGFLEGIDRFDPSLFGILPGDAAAIDPQERLFLETCWNLLEETGHLGRHTRVPRTGVFVGLMYGSYGKLAAAQGWPRGELAGAHSAYWSVANRVSYTFDFSGPSFAVDSACSSSLTAVHLACRSLREGECDMAVAGGVNLILHPSHLVALSSMNMLAGADGCRPFDARADGYVPGEGVGAVLLKPLERALADGDDIWAVIKGSAVNAGGKTSGYTVPNPGAQADLTAEALRRAGVEPATVSFVEAHGTGTELGDPIEIAALNRVFGGTEDSRQPCAISSVKANIGHLEGAAGIAGLTKALLQLRHGRIVPCANLETPNPKIAFAGSRFHLPRTLTEWERPVTADGVVPRRAGVSSFGAGGANVHVVLEEAGTPAAGGPAPAAGEQIFVLSARTGERLAVHAARVAAFLDTAAGAAHSLADLAYSSQVGRREMTERVAVVAATTADLAAALRSFAQDRPAPTVFTRSATRSGPPAALEDLVQRRALTDIARAWVDGAEIDWRLLWPRSRPRRVAFPTYPFEHRRYWLGDPSGDGQPGAAGEPAPAPDADWLVRRVEHRIDPAVYYCAQHRVGGRPWMAGAAVLEIARHACGDAIAGPGLRIDDVHFTAPVAVGPDTTALHVGLERRADTITFRVTGTSETPVVYATGTLRPSGAGAGEPVDLTAARERCPDHLDVDTFYADMARGGLDYGPAMRSIAAVSTGAGEALARLRLAPEADGDAAAPLLHPALLDGALQSVAAVCGASDDHSYLPVGLRRLALHRPLPARCWAYVRETTTEEVGRRRRFDIRVADDAGRAVLTVEGVTVQERPAGPTLRYARPSWRPEPVAPARPEPSVLLVATADDMLGFALENQLAPVGVRLVRVRPGDRFARIGDDGYQVAPGDRDDHRRLAQDLAARGLTPDAVLHDWSRRPFDPAALHRSVEEGPMSLLWLVAALMEQSPGAALRAVYAYADPGVQDQRAGFAPQYAAASGILRTLALEHSRFSGTCVRFAAASQPAETVATLLSDELAATDPSVARVTYHSGRRWRRHTETFVPQAADVPPGRPGGTYLITGGAGALGLVFAARLAEAGPVRLALAGRGPLDDDRSARLDRLRRGGSDVRYYRADLADPGAAERLVAAVRSDLGPVHGVVHAAGLHRDARAVHKTREQFEEVVAPKTAGVVALDAATRDEPLDFFVLFSSVVAESGNPGQADYAYANAFLDEFAEVREQWRAAGRRRGRTRSIGWPLWQEGGMTVDDATRTLLAQRWGMVPMSTAAGLGAFDVILAGDDTSVAVVQGDRSAPPASRRSPAAGTGAPAGEVDRAAVEAALREMASGFLLVEPAEVDLDAELMELGFDSISLTRLVNAVNERYDLDLLPTVLFENPRLTGLAEFLCEEHGDRIAAATAADDPVSAPGPVAAADPAPAPVPVTPKETDDGRAVAVIGMAGTLPGSADLDEFWEHLVAGHDLVREVPADREALRGDPLTRTVRGGFLDRVDLFDARQFGISPREAALMDPQQRIFLQTVWRAVQDAGYRPSQLAGTATGLFAGVSTTDYDELLRENGVRIEAHTATGIAHAILANRVSYLLDLHGPSEAIDTACSSSLVAIHRAVRALRDGECDVAIAGGVNVMLSPGLFSAFTQSGMLSPDGRCKVFDESADGYVRGEGAGAIVLKPLDRALADGDHVYAVVKGTAVNHGGRATSLTAPNPAAQARVIVQAHRDAGVHPSALTYLEAHGTGTGLGDPVEIEGIKKALTGLYADRGEPVPAEPGVALGSVKTNIGHLESAAGIAGVLKVLLALRHRTLPASLHLRRLNPYIRLDGTPLYVNERARPWDSDAPRLAGVSSFGFGGTNAHVLIEEHSPAPAPRTSTPAGGHLLVLSAPAAEALASYADRMARHLRRHPGTDLAALTFTLQTGREEYAERLAVVADDLDGLVRALSRAADGGTAPGLYRATASSRGPGSAVAATADPHEVAAGWTEGASVDWPARWPEPRPVRLPLPAMPLTELRHWFDSRRPDAPAPVAPVEPSPVAPPLRSVTEAPTTRLTPVAAVVPQPPARPARAAVAAVNGAGGRPRISLSAPGTLVLAEPTEPLEAPALDITARTLTQPTAPAPAQPTAPAPEYAPAPVPEPAPASALESVAAPEAGDLRQVADFLREQLGRILGMPPGDIGVDESISGLGLDSILRTDLARVVNDAYGLRLKAAEVYDVDTVSELATFIATRRAASAPAAPSPAAPIPAAESPDTPSAAAPGQAAPTRAPAPTSATSVPAAPAAHEPAPADPRTVEGLLATLISDLVGRPVDGGRTFQDDGFTSFDMLKVVAALEKRFGSLRKTLLFDQPTVGRLAAFLTEAHGVRAVERLRHAGPDGPARDTAVAGPPPEDDGPVVVAKRDLPAQPGLAATVAELERRYGKEGGLPGRDIAPLIFLGADRDGYFNFSRRDDIVLAWSYVGSEERFPALTAQWTAWARRNGLKPSLLSMIRLTEVDGVPFSATPFGAVQRLEDLPGFTLKGNRLQRLRNLVNRFERAGQCRTSEYRVGSDPQVDRQIVDLVDQWAGTKDMVNPYVRTVRAELLAGRLQPRHRMFLTHLDGRPVNAVIVTRIPSENGHLLDLEFYAADAPMGGLDYAIVRIIETLAAEGDTMFSFGATIGAKICESPNADPSVAGALDELRSLGIFTGEGNFRFKNKFRPTNLPVYLCQPADSAPVDVTNIILLIANPTTAAAADGQPAGPAPAPEAPTAPAPAPVSSAPRTAAADAAVPQALPTDAAGRERVLAAHNWNVLRLPHHLVEFDLLTDSWAELAADFVERGTAALTTGAADGADPVERLRRTLQFDHVTITPSGRAAEARLLGCWPTADRVVVCNALFPSWTYNQIDHGMSPAVVRTAAASGAPGDTVFRGDIDLADLRRVLAGNAGRVAFVCVELSTNAGGGWPVSLANLKQVREAADAHGVPLILDAARVVENAAFIVEHEPAYRGRGVWDVALELLHCADGITMSVSKDFGVGVGGLVATRLRPLADRLAEQASLRGQDLNLANRELVARAVGGTGRVVEQVRERMRATRLLHEALRDAGAPVAGPPGGHCVLLDVSAVPALRDLRHPVPAALAWLYRGAGVRCAPHLAGVGEDAAAIAGRYLRLAVPVGLPVPAVRGLARRLAALFRDPGVVTDLMPVPAEPGGGPAVAADTAYYPMDRMPDDIREAIEEGHRPHDDNLAVLREYRPDVRRRLIPADDGDVEVFTAGTGPTVVLMHPFNIGAGFFGPQMRDLADRYQVVVVHYPGVGATRASGDLSVRGLADRMHRTLRRLDVTWPLHVGGASFGGLMAMAFTLDHPDDVASLTLIGSSYKVGNRSGEMNRLSVVAGEDFDTLMRHADPAEIEGTRQRLEDLLLRCESMDPQTGLRYLDEFTADPGLVPRLGEIRTPTLIVHGRHDTVVPVRTGHLLHGLIDTARYEEFADAGHFPSLTASRRFNDLLAHFLDQAGRP